MSHKQPGLALFAPGNHIHILDGGFGTTLEDVFRKDLSTSLWSASLVDEEPDTIVTAHRAFLDAGADVILTSTYQCAFETFDRAGYSETDATRLMHKAVRLAIQAKEEFLKDAPDLREIKVALSLGPYGATLTPAQEFDGFYPPPYGPQSFDPSGANTNAFISTDLDQRAEEALTGFHYRRLQVFASAPDIWASVDCIAFETVPLVREIRAIRRAMSRFPQKPWWISTVWPNGEFPQEVAPGGVKSGIADVTRALFADVADDYLAPDGIGVNCTRVETIDSVASQLRVASANPAFEHKKPFLALYPNGGLEFNVISRTWREHEESTEENWAYRLASIGRREQDTSAWNGVLVGGCCKTAPQHIIALIDTLKQTGT